MSIDFTPIERIPDTWTQKREPEEHQEAEAPSVPREPSVVPRETPKAEQETPKAQRETPTIEPPRSEAPSSDRALVDEFFGGPSEPPPTGGGSPPDDTELVELSGSPRWVGRIARSLFWLLLFLMVALLFAPWVQTASGVGRVIAYSPVDRQQLIEAPTKGRVVQWFVSEGDIVKKGDVLVRLADNDPMLLERLALEKQLVAMQLTTQNQRISDYDDKLIAEVRSRDSALAMIDATNELLNEEVNANSQVVKAEQAALKAAKKQLTRVRKLKNKGLESERKFEVADMKYKSLRAKVESAKAKVRIAKAKLRVQDAKRLKTIQDVDAKLATTRAARRSALNKRSETEQKLQQVESKLRRQENQNEIVAPRDGTVLRLLAAVGQEQVKAGDPLLVLVPSTSKSAVELWVDGNDMPLVQEGQEVRLQFEGWPAVQFSGWPSVAVGTFGGQVDFVDATSDAKGRFRVVVLPFEGDDPWPTEAFLRQGVQAKGWVLLSEVTLGYELWRQINGFPPQLAEEAAARSTAESKGAKKK